jgi:sugar O-acyltransferase (sialic acid O-acetyltransferase NeuD family)
MTGNTSSHLPLVFLGSGGFSLAVAEMFTGVGAASREVTGFSQNVDASQRGGNLGGYPIFTLGELAPMAATHEAISVLGDCAAKRRFTGQAAAMGFHFATLIHPQALVSPRATIGEGTLLGFGGKIGPLCRIGRHCTFNSQTLIGESGVMGDCTYIGPGVQIAGSVTIGEGVFIGIQATIADHVTIGDGAVIGAGAVVIRDVPAGATVVGNPARAIESRGGLFGKSG